MSLLRCSWGKTACPVIVSAAYRASWMKQYYGCNPEGITSIYDNKEYQAAKTMADVGAAIEICRKALDKAYRYRVKRELEALSSKGYGQPILVAPCKPTSKNVLAKTAAEFLGKKLKIDVDTDIREKPCPSRRDSDRRAKFFNMPKFEGPVQQGRVYIMVDDMVTTGATLAELRSHIIRNGGHVGFCCSLASCDAMDKKLDPDSENVKRAQTIFSKLGETVQDYLKNATGLTPETLTNAEAGYFASGKGQYALSQFAQMTHANLG
jgi:hypothetical protein